MKNFESLKQDGNLIWNIANLLRGPYRPPQYRRVMMIESPALVQNG